jgi:hypothetical protein
LAGLDQLLGGVFSVLKPFNQELELWVRVPNALGRIALSDNIGKIQDGVFQNTNDRLL